MVKLIVGDKGKGKTKYLLDMANEAVKSAEGSIVYLDKSTKHMYELNNKIRLINVSDFPINSRDGFIGFISGIISQDHDLEYMFLDSFFKLASVDVTTVEEPINVLEKISERYGITFVISISLDESAIPDTLKDLIVVSL